MTDNSKWNFYPAGDMWVYRSGTVDEIRIEIRPLGRATIGFCTVDFILEDQKVRAKTVYPTAKDALMFCNKLLAKLPENPTMVDICTEAPVEKSP